MDFIPDSLSIVLQFSELTKPTKKKADSLKATYFMFKLFVTFCSL